MANPLDNLNEYRNVFTCPISQEMFQNPVTEGEGTCGHTFERIYIEEWINRKHTCPLSRAPLNVDQLEDNNRLRDVYQPIAGLSVIVSNRLTTLNFQS